jgi:hypothetical protein
MRSTRILVVAVALLSTGAIVDGAAAESQSKQGWHIVRPGDTLEGLSIQYTGDRDGWRELHELNPGILDPNWIYPGRKVRVPLDRSAIRSSAQVREISRRVEARPTPVEWLPAGEGDLLVERDGLRTYEDSSARLLFDDGTTAVISEDSLVFIRRQTPPGAATPSKEIEIETGQAEFASQASDQPAPEIEVVVGSTRSKTRADASGAARSRHRAGDDGAQVMLYQGDGEVTAPMGTVILSGGTGTTVRPGAAPGPAEPLLPAPRLVSPPNRWELAPGAGRQELSWDSVDSAVGYVVEVCGDPNCGELLIRGESSRSTSWTVPQRFRRLVFWRVTARSSSGLDGYPSPARTIRPRLLIISQ